MTETSNTADSALSAIRQNLRQDLAPSREECRLAVLLLGYFAGFKAMFPVPGFRQARELYDHFLDFFETIVFKGYSEIFGIDSGLGRDHGNQSGMHALHHRA